MTAMSHEERKRRLRELWHAKKHVWASASTEYPARRERNQRRNRWGVYTEWRRSHPGVVKLQKKRSDANRYGRKRATEVGPVNLQQIIDAANGLCGICGAPLGDDVTFDHVIPLARGGTHTQDNLQAAHLACNSRKGARILI